MNPHSLLKKFLNKTATHKEIVQLLEYIKNHSKEDFAAVIKQEWDQTSFKEQSELDFQNIYQQINLKLNKEEKEKKRKLPMIIKLAASFSLLFLATYLIHNFYTDRPEEITKIKTIEKVNPTGQKSKIFLPDGSIVWLNAESKLIFPERFDSVRYVELTGEAFFQVKEDSLHPFQVVTGELETTVLGTSFNVNAYSDDENESISLIEGKVTISFMENDTSSLLLPGEQIIINQERGIRQNQYFDSLQVSGWTKGLLVFKNAGKDEIVDKLSRWYGVNIEIIKQPSSTWNVNGYFDNQSLEMVLERLSFSKDFDFTIKDKNVTIKFN